MCLHSKSLQSICTYQLSISLLQIHIVKLLHVYFRRGQLIEFQNVSYGRYSKTFTSRACEANSYVWKETEWDSGQADWREQKEIYERAKIRVRFWSRSAWTRAKIVAWFALIAAPRFYFPSRREHPSNLYVNPSCLHACARRNASAKVRGYRYNFNHNFRMSQILGQIPRPRKWTRLLEVTRLSKITLANLYVDSLCLLRMQHRKIIEYTYRGNSGNDGTVVWCYIYWFYNSL